MADETVEEGDKGKNIVVSFEEEKERIRQQIEQGISNVAGQVKEYDDDKLLRDMNAKHAFINSYGGKPMVMCYTWSNVDNREVIEFRSPDAIAIQYSNQSVQIDKQYQELGRWWIRHASRREYEGIIFDPTLPKEHNKCFNLYQGLAVQPEKGCWKKTLKHLYTMLCNSDREKFEYTLKWFAWCLQNPGQPAEVVMILKGLQGAGKGFIFTQFVEVFGNHGLHISNRKHLTGDFNGHLATCVFLFADEAYYPGDKEVAGALNQLITEKSVATEKKRMDVVKTKNCLHICMATNEEWVIPVTSDTRRYYINKVEGTYAFGKKTDREREEYFNGLWGEMKNGGRAAMVHDLLNMNLGTWHPRFNIPRTQELKEQAQLSLVGLPKIIAGFLENGEFPGAGEKDYMGFTCTTKGLEEYINSNINPQYIKIPPKLKGRLLKKLGAINSHKRVGNTWHFPPLKTCKENFIKEVSADYEFLDMEEEWTTGQTEY